MISGNYAVEIACDQEGCQAKLQFGGYRCIMQPKDVPRWKRCARDAGWLVSKKRQLCSYHSKKERKEDVQMP